MDHEQFQSFFRIQYFRFKVKKSQNLYNFNYIIFNDSRKNPRIIKNYVIEII